MRSIFQDKVRLLGSWAALCGSLLGPGLLDAQPSQTKHRPVYRSSELPESLAARLRNARVLAIDPQQASWIDATSNSIHAFDIATASETAVALPFPAANVAALGFHGLGSPMLAVSKAGAVFGYEPDPGRWTLLDTAASAPEGRLQVYRDPKTLDHCVVSYSVRCYPAGGLPPYDLLTATTSGVFVERLELRFDEPRVGLAILSNGEVLWGNQTGRQSWDWSPTSTKIAGSQAIAVSGHDENFVYVADASGLARFDWTTPALERSPVNGAPPHIGRLYASLGSRMFFESAGRVLEFDAKTGEFLTLPVPSSSLATLSAGAGANGQSVTLLTSGAHTVYTATAFNQSACAVTVIDSRTGAKDDYISIDSGGTGNGAIDRVVRLSAETADLKRNCVFQIGGTKTGVIETYSWNGYTRLTEMTSGTTVKIKIYPNRDYTPLLRLLMMNVKAASAEGKGPVVIAEGGARNPANACQIQTVLDTQFPQPQGHQTLIQTTVTDTNPSCAGLLKNVLILMCNGIRGYAALPISIGTWKVRTTCSVDVTTTDVSQ